jgi:hypothetical protein
LGPEEGGWYMNLQEDLTEARISFDPWPIKGYPRWTKAYLITSVGWIVQGIECRLNPDRGIQVSIPKALIYSRPESRESQIPVHPLTRETLMMKIHEEFLAVLKSGR